MKAPKKSTLKTKTNSKTKSKKKPASIKKTVKKLARKVAEVLNPHRQEMSIVRFAGVSLGGGKTDKTALAILDYYPEQKRVFLRSLRDKVTGKGEITGDEALFEALTSDERGLESIAFDVPLQLPVCVRCELVCPGAEKCSEQAVVWMGEVHKERSKEKRPNKMFTPYTERAAEIYISNKLEESFHPSHALGANAAPLTARAHYLRRRIKTPMIETYPKLSLWRIGQALDIPKSYLRYHRHAIDSDEARLYILKKLIEKEIAFIYQQDMRVMVENDVAFDAFISALTAFLKYRGQTEKRPPKFPTDEQWIEFPTLSIRWF
ncbi:MAG: DUF429 domain-containing protein [Bdellovibrionota bacterium]